MVEFIFDLFEVSDEGRVNGLRMMIIDSGGGSPTICLAVLENSTPTHRWIADSPIFSIGWHHIQFAWDSSGEVLANIIEGDHTKLGAVTWFDGVIVQRLQKTWSGWDAGENQTMLLNCLGWYDDLQIYDYPKGDADGRTVEGPGARQRITCSLTLGKGGGYHIGRIVINSEGEDDQDHGAAGILVECRRANGTWDEVYRSEENNETALDLRINPSELTTRIRITILAADENYFRILQPGSIRVRVRRC